MAEFYRVKGNTWVIETSLMIPVYRIDSERCVFLDSGWEEERPEIEDIIRREGLKPLAVIGTHFHRDHVGNMFWLKEKYGAVTMLPELEALAADNLLLSYSLSVPRSFETVRNGHESILGKADIRLGQEVREIEAGGVRFEIIPAAGHSISQICIVTPDDVVYLADAVLGTREVSKAKMLHHAFQVKSRETMHYLQSRHFPMGIAAHKEITSNPSGLIEKNLAALDAQCETVLWEIYDEPTQQEVLERVIKSCKMVITDIEKAATCERNILYFLNYLVQTGQVRMKAAGGLRHFYRAEEAE